METMKEAYEKLGLSETATPEELENRYTLLMRQAKSEQRRNPDKSDEVEERFAEVTKAYNFILNEETRRSLEEINQKKYGKYKGMAGAAEKTEHFFRYYKYHVLGAIALIGIIIYAAISYIDHREEQERLAKLPPVDLSIMFLGSYITPDGSQDYTAIEDAILAQFPEWKRVEVSVNYVPGIDTGNPNDAALLQKAMLVLATERPDLYIMDKEAFNWVGGNQGMLRSLEPEVEGKFKSLLTPDMLIKGKIGEETTERPLAVDILGSPLTEELPISRNEMFAGIRADSEKEEKAVEFITHYLETSQANK